MKPKSYTPMSGFWIVMVPAVLGGIRFYGYNANGWLPSKIRGIIRPILSFLGQVFDGGLG